MYYLKKKGGWGVGMVGFGFRFGMIIGRYAVSGAGAGAVCVGLG